MICSECKKSVPDDEIVRASNPPICVDCRQSLRASRQLRKEIYAVAIDSISTDLGLDLYHAMSLIESTIIKTAMERIDSIAEIARVLDIKRPTLIEKMKRYSLVLHKPNILSREENLPIGISFSNYFNRFEASISINNEKIYLGKFREKDDAEEIYRVARAYKDAHRPGHKDGFIAFIIDKCLFKSRGV